MAKECLTTNDKAFANRPQTLAAEIFTYDGAVFGFGQYGNLWRQMRKVGFFLLLFVPFNDGETAVGMASQSSSCSSGRRMTPSAERGRVRVTSIGKQKPIFNYDGPPIFCHCGRLTPMWTSWTNPHPSMRFHKCNRCGFFKWVDALILGRARDVMIDLRDAEQSLYEANQILMKKIGS
ncbi:hypothetical protein Tsubulata_001174 [Turnera subulata]|uniref:Uncharacterized protein n=1 Tax=Turnera subulata TaxID=218843 RepID=A0A9Q0GLQ3_9ROSI|nr:hypothetical protein Tsubulata_001174 [Turnera subulata]